MAPTISSTARKSAEPTGSLRNTAAITMTSGLYRQSTMAVPVAPRRLRQANRSVSAMPMPMTPLSSNAAQCPASWSSGK